jgi:hypothetical protein
MDVQAAMGILGGGGRGRGGDDFNSLRREEGNSKPLPGKAGMGSDFIRYDALIAEQVTSYRSRRGRKHAGRGPPFGAFFARRSGRPGLLATLRSGAKC